MTNVELAEKLQKQITHLKSVSGQRYGVFGSPYIDTSYIEEAANRLRRLPDHPMGKP